MVLLFIPMVPKMFMDWAEKPLHPKLCRHDYSIGAWVRYTRYSLKQYMLWTRDYMNPMISDDSNGWEKNSSCPYPPPALKSTDKTSCTRTWIIYIETIEFQFRLYQCIRVRSHIFIHHWIRRPRTAGITSNMATKASEVGLSASSHDPDISHNIWGKTL